MRNLFFNFVTCISLVFVVPVMADTYLEAINYLVDNVGDEHMLNSAVHYVRLGERLPVFLPPFTIYCTIFPFADSIYDMTLEIHELGPGFGFKQIRSKIVAGRSVEIDSMISKSFYYKYSLSIIVDSLTNFAPMPDDSLIPRPSVHYETRLVAGSYADYKWPGRSALIENYYDKFRKRLSITRSGKVDLKVYSILDECSAVNHLSGFGFDIPGGSISAIMNSEYDAALPELLQRFVIYENWGSGSRALAVGMARYFLDDPYRLKSMIGALTEKKLLAALSDESIACSDTFDIICGAFCRFIIDKHGIGVYKSLYERSAPGFLPLTQQLGKNKSEIMRDFIDYVKAYKLDLNMAVAMSDYYRGLMRFDLAEPHLRYLVDSQPDRRRFFLRRLAQNLFDQGKYDEAILCQEKLANLDGSDGEKPVLAITRMRSGQFDIALEELKRLAKRDLNARKAIADYYLDFGMPDSARQYIGGVDSLKDAWAMIVIAKLARFDNKSSRAESLANIGLRIAEKAISDFPGEAGGYISAGYCRLLAGDYDWARADFEAALLVDKRPYFTASALVGLGRVNDALGEKAEAIRCFSRAAEIDNGGYYRFLAKALLKQSSGHE